MGKYRSFNDAKAFACDQKFKNYHGWMEFCSSGKKPVDIPAAPYAVYKNKGWSGYGDFLGTGNKAYHNIVFRSFPQARAFARKLKLKSRNEWIEYCKSGMKPIDIPAGPNNVYRNAGWKSYSEWLNTGIKPHHHKKFRSFEAARSFVHQLNLKTSGDWNKYLKSGKKPKNIPYYPNITYSSEGWISVGDWIGAGYLSAQDRKFRSFEDARSFAQSLKLKNINEWKKYCKSGLKPIDIPTTPSLIYANKGWKGNGDWLGTGNIASWKKIYRPFDQAREYVHLLHLNNIEEWRIFCKSGKKPEDIPSYPNQVYKGKGWQNVSDWLGMMKPIV
jgi:hypothetical protein